MAEYPSNSNKSKKLSEEDRQIQPVVKHETSLKSASSVQKFADIFAVEDAKSVRTYVLTELVIPAIKKIILNALSMWLKTTPTSLSKSSGSGSSITYTQYYQPKQELPSTTIRPLDYPDFGRILFDDRGDAEYVREELLNLRNRYTVVRVSDYYDLARQPAPYTANRYGWTDLSNVEVLRVGDKYTLKLPKAFVID